MMDEKLNSHAHKRHALLWLEELKLRIEAEDADGFNPLLRDAEGWIRAIANRFPARDEE